MDTNRREQILDAARRLGPNAFNRLVGSVDQVRARGRLRYWQEVLIARALGPTGLTLHGAADFVAAFAGAEPSPEPPRAVTREQFFEDPNYWYYLGGAPVPDEWVVEAWEQAPEFRDNVSYEFERQASKLGELDPLRSSLEYLAGVLPLHRMVELYERIRESSPHRESEFRPTFERVFGERMAAFPPPLPESDREGPWDDDEIPF